MTDRELLELAAKAEGHDVAFDEVSGLTLLDANSGVLWNPLHNDGDALRLAVKLRMNIVFGGNYVIVDNNVQAPTINNADDPQAATRRAITRAAAEIGKGMP
jgi:hypothetical protein